jgi:arylsulfatase A-like enzyme
MNRVAFFVLAALVLSCGTFEKPVNVVIIGIDTLRPDHLGCYGYSRATSPNIDRLAGEGVRFESAISASPWTLPSFATVFTSLYPSQHGAGSLQTRLRTVFPTLALILLKNGYSTAGIVNNPTMGADFNMDRGFEYHDLPPALRERTANGTTDDALSWLDRNPSRPFFLFVHYFDPHLPYAPPAPYDTLFSGGYAGPVGNSFDAKTTGTDNPRAYADIRALPIQDWNQIVSLYDGEIAYTDAAVGNLLTGLEERGLRRNTLVVLLSDHGEEFLDHGAMNHGHSLYDELLKVPLIFSLPGRIPANEVIPRQVRLLDVTPTILDILKIKPESHFEGVSLQPLLTGKSDPTPSKTSLLPPEVAYSGALMAGSSERKSVRAYPWKLIYEIATENARLYNLERDPDEKLDLAREEPDVRRLLEVVLFKTVFVSDTWFIEMAAGGVDHTFSLSVGPRGAPQGAKIYLYGLLNPMGKIVDAESSMLNEVSTSEISIQDLRLNTSMTLAFKVEPKVSPIEFDLRIDGTRAAASTFLGEDIGKPKGMPFSQKGTPAGVASEGEPAGRPTAPYFLVWHSGGRFGTESPASLTEETKKRLSALGYEQ